MNGQAHRQSGSKRPSVTKRRSKLVGEQTLTAHCAGSTELEWRWVFWAQVSGAAQHLQAENTKHPTHLRRRGTHLHSGPRCLLPLSSRWATSCRWWGSASSWCSSRRWLRLLDTGSLCRCPAAAPIFGGGGDNLEGRSKERGGKRELTRSVLPPTGPLTSRPRLWAWQPLAWRRRAAPAPAAGLLSEWGLWPPSPPSWPREADDLLALYWNEEKE